MHHIGHAAAFQEGGEARVVGVVARGDDREALRRRKTYGDRAFDAAFALPGPLPHDPTIERAGGGLADHAEHGGAIADQADADGKIVPTLGVFARAVQRIDHPDGFGIFRDVAGGHLFLGDHGNVRVGSAQAAQDQRLGGVVRFRDGGFVGLLHGFEAAGADLHDHLPGLAGEIEGEVEQGTVVHAVFHTGCSGRGQSCGRKRLD